MINFVAMNKNLFDIYLSVVDEVLIYDNSGGKPELIAEKTLESEITILNEVKFNKLKKNTMKTYKRTPNQTKIIEGMDKVYEKLIEFKKKMNSNW